MGDELRKKERAKILNGVNAKTSDAKRSDDWYFVPDLKRCLDDCCTVVSAARFTPEHAYAYKAHSRPKKANCQNISLGSPGIQDFGDAYEYSKYLVLRYSSGKGCQNPLVLSFPSIHPFHLLLSIQSNGML